MSVVTHSGCGLAMAGVLVVLVGSLTGGQGQVGGSIVAVIVVGVPPMVVVMAVAYSGWGTFAGRAAAGGGRSGIASDIARPLRTISHEHAGQHKLSRSSHPIGADDPLWCRMEEGKGVDTRAGSRTNERRIYTYRLSSIHYPDLEQCAAKRANHDSCKEANRQTSSHHGDGIRTWRCILAIDNTPRGVMKGAPGSMLSHYMSYSDAWKDLRRRK